MKNARDILKNVLYGTPCGEENDNKTIDFALKDLRDLMPKKITGKLTPTRRAYNQCQAEVTKILGGV